MDLENMTLEDVASRLAELDEEVRCASEIDIVAKATEEKKQLLERKAELEALEERKTQALELQNGVVEPTQIIEERKEDTVMEENKVLTVDSEEYRSAFYHNLQGKADEAELRALAQADVDGAIPTQTSDKFFEKMKKLAPMLSEITLLQVAGNVKFTVEGTRDAAAKHTENADITAGGNDAFVSVSLGAYEFAKVIKISKSAANMAIDAFEQWLVDILSGDIARAIDNYIINDATNGLTAQTAFECVTVSTNKYSYDDICSLVAKLPAAYDPEAKFLMNKKTLYSKVLNIQDTNKRPIFNPTEKTLMGYPVLIDDYVTSAKADIYFGNFKDIVGNLSSPIAVDSDLSAGFTSGSICFRGWAEFDSKVAKTDAIVKMVDSE